MKRPKIEIRDCKFVGDMSAGIKVRVGERFEMSGCTIEGSISFEGVRD